VGYSLGGRIAAEWAAHHHDRMAGLVLLSARPGLPDEDREARRRWDREWSQVIRENWIIFLHKWYAQAMFAPELRSEDDVERLMAQRRGNNPEHMAETLVNWSPARQRNRWSFLVEYPKPLLYLAGVKDRNYAGLAGTLRTPVRRRRVEILEEAGHAVHLDQPQQCVDILQDFVESNREVLWP